MIIQKINWWLWNQMFQYAFIKALSLRTHTNFKIDILTFNQYKLHNYSLEYFNITKQYANKDELPIFSYLNFSNKIFNIIILYTKIIINKITRKHYIEKQFNFDTDFYNINSWYIEWYFQTEKYFIDFVDEIRKDFEFIIKPSKKNKEIIKKINNSYSVSLHIRRWDYITNSNANNFHWTCDLKYYKEAINIINDKIKNPIFFLFSDDIEWVKENLKLNNEAYYIDWNNADTNYEDMRLMSLCKHNIIANSSFSWWGAWLNKNKEKIVIAPKKWFNKNINYSDVVPNNWLKI